MGFELLYGPKLVEIHIAECWNDITLFEIEDVRLALRELIQFLTGEEQAVYYTNYEDEIVSVDENTRNS